MATVPDLASLNFDKTAYLDVPEGIAVAIVLDAPSFSVLFRLILSCI
jgi:hypothetical protein